MLTQPTIPPSGLHHRDNRLTCQACGSGASSQAPTRKRGFTYSASTDVSCNFCRTGCSTMSIFASRRWVGASKRSEEHTSELQSLMRTSYAVFCLKKKNKNAIDYNHED